MRIWLLADPQQVNSHYRAFTPILSLSQRGHDIRLDGEPPDAERAAEPGWDVVFVYRYTTSAVRSFLRAMRVAGAAIVWDNDDDLTQGPVHRHGALASQRALTGIRETIALADAVTTTSETLADAYAQLGAPIVRVIENHLRSAATRVTRQRRDGLTVGWVAGAEHRDDLERLPIRAALRQLLETHPSVRVESIGVHLGLHSERYRHRHLVQFHDLPQALAEFDIGIAPLADTPFNRARSNVKLKEYAGAGVPWLASPIGPYVGMGERQGGRLVSDDGWFEALDQLVRSDRDRAKLVKRGRRYADGEQISKHLGEWERILEGAVEHRRHSGAAVAGVAG